VCVKRSDASAKGFTGITPAKCVLIMKVTLRKYNFNFVKDILTIFVNVNVTLIVVSGKI
jgi:hypothetical protein